MASLKDALKQVQAELATLKDQCLAKGAEKKGDVAISASGAAPSGNFRATRKLAGHFGKAMSVSFSKNSSDMASAGQDGLLLIWDTEKGCRKVAPIQLPSDFAMMSAISPGSKFACGGGLNNVVSMYSLDVAAKTSNHLGDYEGHDGYVSDAIFIDDSHLLSCSGDSTLCYWDLGKGKDAGPVAKLEEHAADVGGVDVCTTNPALFSSCSNDGTVKFWDHNTGKTTGTIRMSDGDELSKVKFIPGNENCVAVSVAGEAKGANHGQFIVIDRRAMAKLKSFEGVTSKSFECMAVAWSKSGRLLFGGTTDDDDPQGNLLVYDINGTKKPLAKLSTGKLQTHDVAVSSDGCGVAGCNWESGDIKKANIKIFA